ncbi:MAG: hypothetical protein ACOC53_00365 [Candidatus Saliniplasma sp.]
MNERKIVRRISFNKSSLWQGVSFIATAIGVVIAFSNLTLGDARTFFGVPISVLVMTLAIVSSVGTYLLSKYQEIIIYEDGFLYRFTPFRKYDIEFSEVYDINVISKGLKKYRLEFEMINVEDQTIKFSHVDDVKFNEIKNAIISTWKIRKGYYRRIPPPSL